MRIIYHLLGITSSFTEWLSRKSINFVQLNWLLIACSFFLAYFSFQGLIDSTKLNQTPVPLDVDNIETMYNSYQRYVTYEGSLYFDSAIEFGKRKKGSADLKVDKVYVPLLDKNKKGVLIAQEPFTDFTRKPEKAIVTGMLEVTPFSVVSELRNLQVDEKSIQYTINPKSKPSLFKNSLIAFLICIVPFFLLGYSWLKRYKIIQYNSEKIPTLQSKKDDPFSSFDSLKTNTPDLNKMVDCDVTGNLFFEKGGDRYFFDVPTRISFLEDGTIFIASNIDASSSFFGFRTGGQVGIWTIQIRKGDLLEVNNIYQYTGFKRRKAIQVIPKKESENKEFILAFTSKEDHICILNQLLALK